MKKLIMALVAVLMLCSTPAQAVAENEVPFVVSYASGFLYCNNSVGLTDYANGQVFDNDARCLDLSDMMMNNPNSWYELLLQQYPGGIHRWQVNADGKKCVFDIHQASPLAGEFVASEIPFAACAVKLNKQVSETWFMTDYEDPSIAPIYLTADLIGPVNQAVAQLNVTFRKPYRMWLSPRRGSLALTVSASPAGSKIYLQKWVDYRWVTVRTYERYWEPKATYLYKTQSGKYRAVAKSLSGMVYNTGTLWL